MSSVIETTDSTDAKQVRLLAEVNARAVELMVAKPVKARDAKEYWRRMATHASTPPMPRRNPFSGGTPQWAAEMRERADAEPPWRYTQDWCDSAMRALNLAAGAAARLALLHGHEPEPAASVRDRHARQILAVVLTPAESFGDQLGAVAQGMALGRHWMQKRSEQYSHERDQNIGILIDPNVPRWANISGQDATPRAIECQAHINRLQVCVDYADGVIGDVPASLGAAMEDLLEAVPALEQALFSAKILCENFPPGSPLQSLQSKIKEARASIASSAEPSALETRILQGLEWQAADLDGTPDAELVRLAAERSSLVSKINRLAEMAAEAGEDAGPELKDLRRSLKSATEALEARRAEVPVLPSMSRLVEQTKAGDIQAVATIHRYACTLPAAFPIDLAATIRASVVEALIDAGWDQFAEVNAGWAS